MLKVESTIICQKVDHFDLYILHMYAFAIFSVTCISGSKLYCIGSHGEDASCETQNCRKLFFAIFTETNVVILIMSMYQATS